MTYLNKMKKSDLKSFVDKLTQTYTPKGKDYNYTKYGRPYPSNTKAYQTVKVIRKKQNGIQNGYVVGVYVCRLCSCSIYAKKPLAWYRVRQKVTMDQLNAHSELVMFSSKKFCSLPCYLTWKKEFWDCRNEFSRKYNVNRSHSVTLLSPSNRRPLKITILGREDEQMLKLLQYSLWKRCDYCIKCNHTWNNLLNDQN